MKSVIKVKPLIRKNVVFRNGRKRMKIKLNLYVDDILQSYDKAQQRLVEAEKAIRTAGTQESSIEYGRAATDLLQTVFGIECTAAIIKFYEGRYIQMLADVYPFIQKEILPHLNDPFAQVLSER